GLVVEVGHRELGAERPKGLGASPGDRLLVGDADDETSLALEQLCFDHGNHGTSSGSCAPRPRPGAFQCFEAAKGATSALGVIDLCEFTGRPPFKWERHDFRSSLFRPAYLSLNTTAMLYHRHMIDVSLAGD